jgi:hypothetical protein
VIGRHELPARGSRQAEAQVKLSCAAVVESLGLVALAWRAFGLGADVDALHTFGVELLFFFGLFTVFAVRTPRRFWRSRASRTLVLASSVDALVMVTIAIDGPTWRRTAPPALTALVIGYAAVFALGLNDVVKAALLRPFGGRPLARKQAI